MMWGIEATIVLTHTQKKTGYMYIAHTHTHTHIKICVCVNTYVSL